MKKMDTPFNIEDLFCSLINDGPVALAVSGGGDSTALMHLFAQWRAEHPLSSSRDLQDVVFSVDHGLRSEAALEVEVVMKEAHALGFKAVPLKLDDFTGGASVQARARDARYLAMASEMSELGLTHLLTAHTLDDQAETFLMRLMRGSGIDGLSSILAERPLFGVQLMRPLLAISGVALREWLSSKGIEWVEDPSNHDDDYERVRVRRLLSELDDVGQFSTKVAESVKRLQRGRFALEESAVEFVKNKVTSHRIGVLHFKGDLFADLSEEVQIRVLRRILLAFGIEGRRLSSLEGGVTHLLSMGFEKFVLAGVLCEKKKDGVFQFSREVERAELENISQTFSQIDSGAQSHCNNRFVIWDSRVLVSIPDSFSGELVVRGFSKKEIHKLQLKYRELGQSLPRIAAAQTIFPAVAGCWCDGELVAVPQLEPYDESLLIDLFGNLDQFLDDASFKRAEFPLNNWKLLIN